MQMDKKAMGKTSKFLAIKEGNTVTDMLTPHIFNSAGEGRTIHENKCYGECRASGNLLHDGRECKAVDR